MQAAKLAIYIACGCSTFAIIAVLLVVPSLYQQINELHDDVMDGMSTFKVLFAPVHFFAEEMKIHHSWRDFDYRLS